MSCSSEDSEFEDIKEFFSESEWKDMDSYEKNMYRNVKRNYHHMQHVGLEPKLPVFMRRKQPAKRPKKSGQLQARSQPSKQARRSFAATFNDGHLLPTSPQPEGRLLLSSLCPIPARTTATGKENLDPGVVSSGNDLPDLPEASEAPPAPRYPRRVGAQQRNYTEPELHDDDDFLFCDDCQREWEGDCPEHGPLQVIADTEVPVGHPERALLTVPPQLTIEVSKIPGAGRGVWTRQAVPRRVRFGPYEGDTVRTSEETGYGWEIRRDGKPSHCVDALDTTSSNWMRFVNCARHLGEENLFAYQYKGQLYYRTVRDIPANTELLVWYGDSYARELHIDPIAYKDSAQRDLAGAFLCETCSICFVSPMLLAQHHRSSKCSASSRWLRGSAVLLSAFTGRSSAGEEHSQGGENQVDQVEQAGTAGASGDKSNKRYRCDCGAAYRKSSRLKEHMRTHSGVKPHICAICEAGFARGNDLNTHMRTHTDEKPHICTTCGNSFTCSSDLHRHMRTHTNDKIYSCPTCRASFKQSTHLRRHMRTHTGEKPFTCSTCHQGFVQSSNLQRHIVREHTSPAFRNNNQQHRLR